MRCRRRRPDDQLDPATVHPMHKPAEAAFHDPAAREHDKAFLSWVTFDHTMAHAVPVRPTRDRMQP
jgi:hypothetical protein